MRTLFEQELRDLQRDVFRLGNLVCDTLAEMLTAGYRRDFVAIERLYESDLQARETRMKLNERVVRVVATQNPLAADLRNLFFLTHMADELLRISAQCSGIGRLCLKAEEESPLFEEDVFHMGQRAVAMLDGALGAAIRGDEEILGATIAMDDEIDIAYEQISRECSTRMDARDCEKTSTVLGAYKLARRMEIIGDSIVNLCRWWLFFNGCRDSAADIRV
ncbi:MAG: hypothetical protein LBD02_04240 [Christensenellaceae bacterium]|jgi:phosphate transport system protein|nr:hypothetical protein [Christensenellaceae bacterium]